MVGNGMEDKGMYKIYRTIEGDTFDSIAFRIFGDEHLMHALLAHNPELVDTVIFSAGVEVKIPDITIIPRSVELPAWFSI